VVELREDVRDLHHYKETLDQAVDRATVKVRSDAATATMAFLGLRLQPLELRVWIRVTAATGGPCGLNQDVLQPWRPRVGAASTAVCRRSRRGVGTSPRTGPQAFFDGFNR
jgi:hypothetical protein